MNNAPTPTNYSGLKPYGKAGNGRTLLVNSYYKQMLDQFAQISHEDSSRGYHAKALTKAVEGLRGCASPANSFIKNGNPSRRCVVFSDFEIEYELNSYYGGPQTDVEIVDIRLTPQTTTKIRRAALWQATCENGVWQTANVPEYTLKGSESVPETTSAPIKIGINGFCENINHAARMLPAHIARGDQTALDALEDTGYQLFYIPQNGYLKAGWSFLRDLGRISPSDLQSARILANHMNEAHDQGLHVEWTSHRGGSKVLTQAMKLLAQKQINLNGKQQIFLSDHTSSHYAADVARRAIGMNTGKDDWHKSTKGIAQLIGGQSFGGASIACSINEFMYHTKPEERPGKAVKGLIKAGGTAYGAHQTAPMIAELVAKFALTSAYASMLLNAVGYAATAGLVAASIPSLNEGFSKGPLDPIANLANKTSKHLKSAIK